MIPIMAILARLGVPEPLRKVVAYIGLTIAAIAILALAKHFYDNAVEARYEAKVQAQVTKATEAANTAATEAVTATKTEVERTNEDARNAASGSADPLKSGLDSLRAKGAASPSPR